MKINCSGAGGRKDSQLLPDNQRNSRAGLSCHLAPLLPGLPFLGGIYGVHRPVSSQERGYALHCASRHRPARKKISAGVRVADALSLAADPAGGLACLAAAAQGLVDLPGGGGPRRRLPVHRLLELRLYARRKGVHPFQNQAQMKTKLLYVLVSGPDDVYREQSLFCDFR